MTRNLHICLLPLDWHISFIGGNLREDGPVPLYVENDFSLHVDNMKTGERIIAFGSLEQCFRTVRANIAIRTEEKKNG